MQINELPSIKKRVQRIGRSGKRGSYSGRGVKGQKSRAGRRLRPAERDLILRIPKKRGFKNHPKRPAAAVIGLGEFAKGLKSFAKAGEPLAVDPALLAAAGLVRARGAGRVKILADGEIDFPVRVKGLMVSEAAKAKIEKAGGAVI